MTRIIVMCIIMAFAVGFVGCRSCLSPYDQCQPTFLPERGDQCMGELYRCGSNLGGLEQRSNATGDCENCGGGSVEYYSEDGSQVSYIENANAIPAAAALTPYTASSNLGAYGEDFSLNTEYEPY